MSGRIRSIKPEVLEDEDAAGLTDPAWRLWVSSWVLADDHGRFRAGAKYLAANVWQDTAQIDKAEAALKELADRGFVRRYVVGTQRYAEIKPKGWQAHQRIDHPGKPRVPVPNETDYLDAIPRESSAPLEKHSESVGDPLPSRARARPPTSDLRPPTSDPREDRDPPRVSILDEVARAYADGIADAAGTPWRMPDPNLEAPIILDAIATHQQGLRGDDLSRWVKRSAATYRRKMADCAQYQKGFRPSKWLEWLNGGGERMRVNGLANGSHQDAVICKKDPTPDELARLAEAQQKKRDAAEVERQKREALRTEGKKA